MISEVISNIRPHNSILAVTLEQYAMDFTYDAILDVVREVKKK